MHNNVSKILRIQYPILQGPFGGGLSSANLVSKVSNMGYSLLGMIIESVTNKRYEKYLAENILKSLEMYKSTFQFCNSK